MTATIVAWLAVATAAAFAVIIAVLDVKLHEARKELVRWRVIGAGIALDKVGDEQAALDRIRRVTR